MCSSDLLHFRIQLYASGEFPCSFVGAGAGNMFQQTAIANDEDVSTLLDDVSLQIKSVVTAVAGARSLDESVDEGQVILGEKGNASEDALLQVALGEKIQGERVGMAAQGLVALQLESGGEPAQTVHLIEHFRCGNIGSVAEAFILRAHPCSDRFELLMECVAGGCEFTFAFDRHDART